MVATEFYKVYRPARFKDVLGQPEAVRCLNGFVAAGTTPQTILLSGPSGTGKTTLARILRAKLGCGDYDFQEINCSKETGIDTIRAVDRGMTMAPMSGTCRVYLLDEVQQLTKAAQSAILKILEDTPKNVYFMLATTNPEKLLPTVITRCTHIKLKPLDDEEMAKLLAAVIEKAGIEVSKDVAERIVDCSEGSARQALVYLNQISGIADEAEQLQIVQRGEVKREAFQLAQAMFRKSSWGDVAAILRTCEGEPESLRYMILGYATKVLLGGGKQAGQAAVVIDMFARNFYDSKRAGLVLACWDVVNAGKK